MYQISKLDISFKNITDYLQLYFGNRKMSKFFEKKTRGTFWSKSPFPVQRQRNKNFIDTFFY